MIFPFDLSGICFIVTGLTQSVFVKQTLFCSYRFCRTEKTPLTEPSSLMLKCGNPYFHAQIALRFAVNLSDK